MCVILMTAPCGVFVSRHREHETGLALVSPRLQMYSNNVWQEASDHRKERAHKLWMQRTLIRNVFSKDITVLCAVFKHSSHLLCNIKRCDRYYLHYLIVIFLGKRSIVF